jgi:hypothetical protein
MTAPIRLAVAVATAFALTVGPLTVAAAAPAPIDPFAQTTVAGQLATRLVASYPTDEQATSAFRGAACLGGGKACAVADVTQYYAYYGDRTTGGFTTRPGFVSGVGAEYAGVDGKGTLLVSVSSYATSPQALRAIRTIARGAGMNLKRAVRGVIGPPGWDRYDIWTGASTAGDQGLLVAISGSKYVRFWAYPPSRPWKAQQWRKAFQGFAPLLPQMMTAQQQFVVAPDLDAYVPVMPQSLVPVFFATQDKAAWLPYGRPDPALFDAMGQRQLSLQYAIAGAPETLALNVTITPVSDPSLAQAQVDRLLADTTVSGTVAIEGMPAGAQVVHIDDAGVERLIYAQMVARGALVEITCSDLSITSDLVSGRAACLTAIRDAATAATAP